VTAFVPPGQHRKWGFDCFKGPLRFFQVLFFRRFSIWVTSVLGFSWSPNPTVTGSPDGFLTFIYPAVQNLGNCLHSNNMKINFLLPHIKISGGVRIGLNYANLLAERGHQVKVIVVCKSYFRRTVANLLGLKPIWYKDFKAEILRIKKNLKIIPRADISVACDWRSAQSLNSLTDSKGKKFHLIMHDERLYHGDHEIVSRIYQYSLYKIAISNWIRERLLKYFNIDSTVLITPVDFNLFHEMAGLRNHSGLRILMLHHVYIWKGIEEGIGAFQAVQKIVPDIKMILFGVKRENPSVACDEYHYNLPQKELAKLYSSCDIFLCPSDYEGLGMPAMEAMACGCAVVTFDTGGSRDYAFDGQTAFVARHGDVKDLTAKLLNAVTDKAQREKIARAGQRYIKEKFDTWEESTVKLESLFIKALDQHGSSNNTNL
jgi:glycosyltransferase involved in cell wall biosynthesis